LANDSVGRLFHCFLPLSLKVMFSSLSVDLLQQFPPEISPCKRLLGTALCSKRSTQCAPSWMLTFSAG